MISAQGRTGRAIKLRVVIGTVGVKENASLGVSGVFMSTTLSAVGERLFNGQLSRAIGVDRGLERNLGNRGGVRCALDRGGRGEVDAGNATVAHGEGQRLAPLDMVATIFRHWRPTRRPR